jgi:hypothetical protein
MGTSMGWVEAPSRPRETAPQYTDGVTVSMRAIT